MSKRLEGLLDNAAAKYEEYLALGPIFGKDENAHKSLRDTPEFDAWQAASDAVVADLPRAKAELRARGIFL